MGNKQGCKQGCGRPDSQHILNQLGRGSEVFVPNQIMRISIYHTIRSRKLYHVTKSHNVSNFRVTANSLGGIWAGPFVNKFAANC
jgi:hypothetical protein